jgi:hypothetical protein
MTPIIIIHSIKTLSMMTFSIKTLSMMPISTLTLSTAVKYRQLSF